MLDGLAPVPACLTLSDKVPAPSSRSVSVKVRHVAVATSLAVDAVATFPQGPMEFVELKLMEQRY
jgi:hypothetical protein